MESTNFVHVLIFIGGIYYLFFHETGKKVTGAVVDKAKEAVK